MIGSGGQAFMHAVGVEWDGTNETRGRAAAACPRGVQSTCCLCCLRWWSGECWQVGWQGRQAWREGGREGEGCPDSDFLPCIGARAAMGLSLTGHCAVLVVVNVVVVVWSLLLGAAVACVRGWEGEGEVSMS